MRLPLVPLSEWVLNRQNEFELKLFESFRQEFNIRDNEEFNIYERYGSYDGQMKFCRDFATMLSEDIQSNLDMDDFRYTLNKEEIKDYYKGLFFDNIHLICNKTCQTGYQARKSEYNPKTLTFKDVYIYINIKEYNKEKDITVVLTHELTHAYDDWNRHSKEGVETLLDIEKNKGYDKLVDKIKSNDFNEKIASEMIYTFTSIEKNAYMSELTAEIESIGEKIKDYTYMDALKIFKNSDTWKRFNQFKEYFMLMNEEEKKVLCDVYREIKKSSKTDNKILKQLKYDIQETFDKMCTIIPKIYYYYKEKHSNKEIKKEKISESRLNRIKKRFNII